MSLQRSASTLARTGPASLSGLLLALVFIPLGVLDAQGSRDCARHAPPISGSSHLATAHHQPHEPHAPAATDADEAPCSTQVCDCLGTCHTGTADLRVFPSEPPTTPPVATPSATGLGRIATTSLPGRHLAHLLPYPTAPPPVIAI